MSDRAAQTAALTAYAFGFFRYRPPLSVADWAQSSVELSGRVTEQSGPYSLALHPYVAEVLETIRNPNVKRVSLCWGSQTAKTTSFYVMLGFVIDAFKECIPNSFSRPWQPSRVPFSKQGLRHKGHPASNFGAACF